FLSRSSRALPKCPTCGTACPPPPPRSPGRCPPLAAAARRSSRCPPVPPGPLDRPGGSPPRPRSHSPVARRGPPCTAEDLRELAGTLARTTDATIFGANEFTVRDLVLRVGAEALEAALEERQEGVLCVDL